MHHINRHMPRHTAALFLIATLTLTACWPGGREDDPLGTQVMGAVQATADFQQAVATSVAATVAAPELPPSAMPTQPATAVLPFFQPAASPTATQPTAPPSPFDATQYLAADRWGRHGSGAGRLNNPRALAFGADGAVYILDEQNSRVMRTWDGKLSVFYEGDLHFPTALAVDAAGQVYVLEGFGSVQVISPAGTPAVTFSTDSCGSWERQYLVDIALGVDASLLVADVGNQRVMKLTLNGSCLMTWGRDGKRPGDFGYPSGIAVDNQGNIHVLDLELLRVQKFTFDGRLLEVRGQEGGGEEELYGANDLAIDAEGNIYLVDSLLHRVQKFDSNFRFITSWPTSDGLPAGEYDHDSIVVGPDGRVYVTVSNLRVRERSNASKAGPPLSQVLVFRPDGLAQVP